MAGVSNRQPTGWMCHTQAMHTPAPWIGHETFCDGNVMASIGCAKPKEALILSLGNNKEHDFNTETHFAE